ncbi:type I phosphomannose isomerase catalytic subunit [Paraclostridium sordellii]
MLKKLGKELPIMIKVIEADDTLSVQVHPDDEYAKIHENDSEKT